jgi:hypothetical protein
MTKRRDQALERELDNFATAAEAANWHYEPNNRSLTSPSFDEVLLGYRPGARNLRSVYSLLSSLYAALTPENL